MVRIKIAKLNLSNFAFYDLLEIINIAYFKNKGYIINLVKNLITKYFENDNCITILATFITTIISRLSTTKLTACIAASYDPAY